MSFLIPSTTIRRIPFLLRSAATYALLVFWLVASAALATWLDVAIHFGPLRGQIDPFAIYIVGSVVFLLGLVGIVALQYKFAVHPRLRDIGFRGGTLSIMAVLWIIPPTSPLLMLTLLFAPSGFIQVQEVSKKHS